MAFYIEHMRATGGNLYLLTLEPADSGPAGRQPPQCYFTHPDLPGRYAAS